MADREHPDRHASGGAGSSRAGSSRDEQAVTRFVERMAGVLADAGMARMPARVFVALLAADTGRLTASELAERLQVSPAAISGAVRYLVHMDMLGREREPGSRRDFYVVHDDVWYEASVHKDQLYRRWSGLLAEGVSALGPDTPAGRRLDESRVFFDFLHEEMPALLKKWREYREEWRAGRG
ncbi:MAG: MarR family transcriptional regulator [Micromonosporaceae bacterium]|nr:MarR family transcriptional regulator [Micromonosporaceae bacterium]